MGILRKAMQDQDDKPSGKQDVGGASDFPDEQIKREIAERLRHALKLAGGPSKISANSGISLRTIANYTSERSELKASALVRLAEACDVSLDWLATGTPPVHRLDRLAQFEADAGEAVVPLPTRMRADLGGEQHFDQRVKDVAAQLRTAGAIFRKAVDVVGWEPPAAFGQALRTLIFKYEISLEDAVAALDALKYEVGQND